MQFIFGVAVGAAVLFVLAVIFLGARLGEEAQKQEHYREGEK
jgi:hypothetical protein